jgi:hypothetical protein
LSTATVTAIAELDLSGIGKELDAIQEQWHPNCADLR